jgi:hypothetical protein
MSRRFSSDARLIAMVSGIVLAVILVAAFIAPAREDNDPVPSTDNSGSMGAKAAFLLLNELGYKAHRWDKSTAALSATDAATTTLILAEPQMADERADRTALAAFLDRGGRILATGAVSALMLPAAKVGPPGRFYTALCRQALDARVHALGRRSGYCRSGLRR